MKQRLRQYEKGAPISSEDKNSIRAILRNLYLSVIDQLPKWENIKGKDVAKILLTLSYPYDTSQDIKRRIEDAIEYYQSNSSLETTYTPGTIATQLHKIFFPESIPGYRDSGDIAQSIQQQNILEALRGAAEGNQLAIIDKYTNPKYGLNTKNSKYQTVLLEGAVFGNQPSLVEHLLAEYSYDIATVKTSAFIAAHSGKAAIVEILLQKVPDLRNYIAQLKGISNSPIREILTRYS